MKTQARRILIVGPSWVGDMVMAQCLFRVLRQKHPEVSLDVLAPAWSRPLLEHMPEVDRAIDLPFGHSDIRLSERYRLGRSLAGAGYQQALVLPNSLKSALVPFWASIPLRTGWRGEMRYGLLNDMRRLDKQRYPLMIQRFAALAYAPDEPLPQELPWPHLVADPARRAALLARLGLEAGRPVLALCPGAEFGPAKRWPEEHFAAVAEAKIAAGWQIWLLGSERDKPVVETIVQSLPEAARSHCHNLAGVTGLDEAIDLLAAADAVVSNDSGLMHIAAALDRPLVVLYGSTSPEFTPPLARQVRTLSIPVDCGPCFQRTCPQQHLRCLRELEPQRVLGALQELLPQSPLREPGDVASKSLAGVAQ